jgi:peptide deformylase
LSDAFVRHPDPRLAKAAPPQPFVDAAMLAVGGRLLAAAREVKAYGLAAAHIGEVAPVVVVSRDGGGQDYFVLYNARVAAVAPETTKGEEGSVSLPGVRLEIERPNWVTVDFMDEAGTQKSTRFDGFAARVALHEIEQTQGIFFLDKVSRLKRDMAMKKARKQAG